LRSFVSCGRPRDSRCCNAPVQRRHVAARPNSLICNAATGDLNQRPLHPKCRIVAGIINGIGRIPSNLNPCQSLLTPGSPGISKNGNWMLTGFFVETHSWNHDKMQEREDSE
jgi:hypothetical protein